MRAARRGHVSASAVDGRSRPRLAPPCGGRRRSRVGEPRAVPRRRLRSVTWAYKMAREAHRPATFDAGLRVRSNRVVTIANGGEARRGAAPRRAAQRATSLNVEAPTRQPAQTAGYAMNLTLRSAPPKRPPASSVAVLRAESIVPSTSATIANWELGACDATFVKGSQPPSYVELLWRVPGTSLDARTRFFAAAQRVVDERGFARASADGAAAPSRAGVGLRVSSMREAAGAAATRRVRAAARASRGGARDRAPRDVGAGQQRRPRVRPRADRRRRRGAAARAPRARAAAARAAPPAPPAAAARAAPRARAAARGGRRRESDAAAAARAPRRVKPDGGVCVVEWAYSPDELAALPRALPGSTRHVALFADVASLLRAAGHALETVSVSRDDRARMPGLPRECHFGNGTLICVARLPAPGECARRDRRRHRRRAPPRRRRRRRSAAQLPALADMHFTSWWHPLQQLRRARRSPTTHPRRPAPGALGPSTVAKSPRASAASPASARSHRAARARRRKDSPSRCARRCAPARRRRAAARARDTSKGGGFAARLGAGAPIPLDSLDVAPSAKKEPVAAPGSRAVSVPPSHTSFSWRGGARAAAVAPPSRGGGRGGRRDRRRRRSARRKRALVWLHGDGDRRRGLGGQVPLARRARGAALPPPHRGGAAGSRRAPARCSTRGSTCARGPSPPPLSVDRLLGRAPPRSNRAARAARSRRCTGCSTSSSPRRARAAARRCASCSAGSRDRARSRSIGGRRRG